MITSVVVMSGVTEAKCSNCCELSIGLRVTSGRWCEWSTGRGGVAVVSGVVVVGGVVVVSGVKEEKCSNWFEFTIGSKATSCRCCE